MVKLRKQVHTNSKTDPQYWENFWKNVTLPSRPDPNITSEKGIMDTLSIYLPKGDKQTTSVIEIGCAPGKWLVYFYEYLGYLPFGIEYIDSAAEATIKNLKICDIYSDKQTINCVDFLSMDHTNVQKHDVVVSFGFIEHFSNPEEIISMQMSHLKSGGYLVIGIPKFTGLNKYLAQITDRYSGRDILNTHNLQIMNLSYFKELCNKLDLDEVFIGNVGGFEKGLFLADGLPKYISAVILILNRLFHCSFIRKMNPDYISSYIIGIYKKN